MKLFRSERSKGLLIRTPLIQWAEDGRRPRPVVQTGYRSRLTDKLTTTRADSLTDDVLMTRAGHCLRMDSDGIHLVRQLDGSDLDHPRGCITSTSTHMLHLLRILLPFFSLSSLSSSLSSPPPSPYSLLLYVLLPYNRTSPSILPMHFR